MQLILGVQNNRCEIKFPGTSMRKHSAPVVITANMTRISFSNLALKSFEKL